jgi:hypothetical protein
MRKENLIVTAAATIATALLILIVLVGSQAQTPLQLERTATVESNGMQLRVEADKEQYAIGESVRIVFFQKNLRNEPAMLGIGKIEVIVRDSNGQSVLGVIIDSTWDPTFKIAPMEETEVGSPFLWDQTDSNYQQVPAGTYTINMTLDGTPFELRIAVGS